MKLRHETRGVAHSDSVRPPASAFKSFFAKFSSRSMIGLSLLGGAGFVVAPLIVPAVARAQEGEFTLGGRAFKVLGLSETLSAMDAASGKYRGHERLSRLDSRDYINEVNVSGEVRFMLMYNAQYSRWAVHTTFPVEREAPEARDKPAAGTRTAHLNDFVRFVEANFGQKVVRFKMIVQSLPYEENGQTKTNVRLYLLPTDAQGRTFTKVGFGQHLVYLVNYYDNTSESAMMVVSEPPGKDTLVSPLDKQFRTEPSR